MAFKSVFWLITTIILLIAGVLEARTTGNVSILFRNFILLDFVNAKGWARQKKHRATTLHYIHIAHVNPFNGCSGRTTQQNNSNFVNTVDGFIDHQDLCASLVFLFADEANIFFALFVLFLLTLAFKRRSYLIMSVKHCKSRKKLFIC